MHVLPVTNQFRLRTLSRDDILIPLIHSHVMNHSTLFYALQNSLPIQI